MLYICVVPLNFNDKDCQVFSYPFHKKQYFHIILLFILRLNMFLVPIKLRPSKFSPYLILITFLILQKNITYNFSPC